MFGEILRDLRKQRGLTAGQMSEILGVAEGTYRNYEHGRREPSFEVLNKLATFFNVSTDFLLGREAFKEQVNPILQLTHDEMEQRLLKAYFNLPQQLRDIFMKSMKEELDREQAAAAGIQQKRHTHEATIGELQDAAAAETEAKKGAG